MYGIHREDITPLQKLLECKFTTDGKYVIYEGKAYSCETGDELPINEAWTLSDVLHASGDVLSAGADFVIPGSGAIIDTLNAISYIIEAQFTAEQKKDSLYLMAAITFAFVALPGPLQAVAIPLKRVLKGGIKVMSPPVKAALGVVGGILPKVLDTIPNFMNKALGSKFGKNIMGKWGTKIAGFFADFSKRVKVLFSSITGKAAKEGTEKIYKNVFDGIAPIERSPLFDKWMTTLNKNIPIKNLWTKVNKLKNIKFDPSKVKITNKGIHLSSSKKTRQVLEIQLPTGDSMLMYVSTGTGAPTLKQAGDWQALSGFVPKFNNANKSIVKGADFNSIKNADIDWFIKDEATTQITKGANKYMTDLANFLKLNGPEKLGISGLKNITKSTTKAAAKTSLTTATRTSLFNFFKRTPNIAKASTVLRKAGFVPGKTYRYTGPKGMTTGTIKSITDSQVSIVFKNGTLTTFPATTFIKNAIGAPWTRRGYGVIVPLFVKRFSDMLLSDGSNIDYNRLEQFQDLDPNTTSQESLEYMQEEVSPYQGDTRQYTVQTNVTTFQNGLQALGYTLPRFGVDGKFGPETQAQLKQFQQKNGLDGSIGKMDRLTARKISELLKVNNVTNSQQLQNQLNAI